MAAANAALAVEEGWTRPKLEDGRAFEITAGCANVSPGGAIIIGAVAGVLVVISVLFVDRIKT